MCTSVANHFGMGRNLDDLRIDGRSLTADEKTFGKERPGDKRVWGLPVTAVQRISNAKIEGVLNKSGNLVKKEAPKAAPKAAPQPVASNRASSGTGESKIAPTAAPKGTGAGKSSLVSGGVDGANVGRKTLLGA